MGEPRRDIRWLRVACMDHRPCIACARWAAESLALPLCVRDPFPGGPWLVLPLAVEVRLRPGRAAARLRSGGCFGQRVIIERKPLRQARAHLLADLCEIGWCKRTRPMIGQ